MHVTQIPESTHGRAAWLGWQVLDARIAQHEHCAYHTEKKCADELNQRRCACMT